MFLVQMLWMLPLLLFLLDLCPTWWNHGVETWLKIFKLRQSMQR